MRDADETTISQAKLSIKALPIDQSQSLIS